MIEHTNEEDPNECCGMLAISHGEVVGHYRITNTERSPYRYKMDAREHMMTMHQIEDAGNEVAYYHSHTHSPAYPSATDIRLVTFAESFYLLISPHEYDSEQKVISKTPQIRAFLITDGNVAEESVVTSD